MFFVFVYKKLFDNYFRIRFPIINIFAFPKKRNYSQNYFKVKTLNESRHTLTKWLLSHGWDLVAHWGSNQIKNVGFPNIDISIIFGLWDHLCWSWWGWDYGRVWWWLWSCQDYPLIGYSHIDCESIGPIMAQSIWLGWSKGILRRINEPKHQLKDWTLSF